MKTPIIAKVGLVILACSILAVFLVPAGFASIEGHGVGETSAGTSCTDKTSTFFPAFIYTKLYMGRNGATSGFEIHLSDADGDCSGMLYSSTAAEGRMSFAYHQDNDDMVIVSR